MLHLHKHIFQCFAIAAVAVAGGVLLVSYVIIIVVVVVVVVVDTVTPASFAFAVEPRLQIVQIPTRKKQAARQQRVLVSASIC